MEKQLYLIPLQDSQKQFAKRTLKHCLAAMHNISGLCGTKKDHADTRGAHNSAWYI